MEVDGEKFSGDNSRGKVVVRMKEKEVGGRPDISSVSTGVNVVSKDSCLR